MAHDDEEEIQEDDAQSCAPSNCEDIPDVSDVEETYFKQPIPLDEWGSIISPPKEIINPLRMCAVNQFVQLMQPTKDPYISTSCELVLVFKGTQVPEHFRMMVYAMDCLNKMPSLKGSFVPHTGLTRPLTVVTGKTKTGVKFDVTGVERVLVSDESKQDEVMTNFIQTTNGIPTFRARCAKTRANKQVQMFAHVNPVEMVWGIVPVEYELQGVKKRLIFQVLRVIPQPGFHLMDAIRRRFFSKRKDAKPKEERMVADVCYYLVQILNHEADINYGMDGGWTPQNPNPWTVTQPHQPTSVESMLSPFTVLERILHHIPGGYTGNAPSGGIEMCVDVSTLNIGGFPAFATSESAQVVWELYQKLHGIYLKKLCCFYKEFGAANESFATNDTFTHPFRSVLRGESGINLNRFDLYMQMCFTLGNFMKFSERKEFKDAERFMFPKAVVACLDFFLFNKKSVSGMATSEDKCVFVKAHVGDQLFDDKVTETKIAAIYRVCSEQSIVDFPKACQSKAARDSLRKHLHDHVDAKIAVDEIAVHLYENHMTLQLTTTMNGLALDQWMSDRVYFAACLMNQLSSNKSTGPCAGIRNGRRFLLDGNGPHCKLVHDECALSWCVLNAGLCRLNQTVRANPLNLNLIWAMLNGDVLTFLGLHNETWRWMMYCVMVASCYGHLRAVTQDGHSKNEEVPLTAKPNSVGLNEVVVKTVNFCLEGLLSSLLPLSEEERRCLGISKQDRVTRAAVEEASAVGFANGQIVSKPLSSQLMQAVLFDEALRSANKELLDGLTTTALPRDSNAGEGTVTKLLKPERGGAFEKGVTRQLPGMGWYVLCFASNTNAMNSVIGEIIGTLAKGAMLVYPPGAPQSTGLASSLAVRDKRKRGQATRSAMWTGESMMPTSMEERQHLAYVLSVGCIYARHLGLMNKSAHSDWEISSPVYMYVDWFKKYFMEHFSCMFSAYLGESCDRIIKGVIARAVASCHVCTVISNFDRENDYSNEDMTFSALYNSMMAMEASSMTLYWANLALLNSITHVVDSKLVIVNQLIRWKCQMPVLPVDYLELVLQPLDATSVGIITKRYVREHAELGKFLKRVLEVRARQQDNPNEPIRHFQGNYIQVPGLGTSADYAHIESYLLRFCGVNTGSKQTYMQMFHEVASKSVDLTGVLDMTRTMISVKTLFENFGLEVGSACDSQPGGYHHRGHTYLIRAVDPEDAKAAVPTGKIWVHIGQALLIASLTGNVELHADNSIHVGKGIFNLIARKTVPQQAVPSMMLMLETFTFKQGDVIADTLEFKTTRQYFFRPQICYKAWRCGEIHELNKVIGNLPLEDTVHIHAWVQMHTNIVRKPPQSFYYIPMRTFRSPELVPGRIYPLKGALGNDGVICLCPGGYDCALIRIGQADVEVVALSMWTKRLNDLCMQVGPLVYRKHAAIEYDGGVGVLLSTDPEFPMDVVRRKCKKIHKDIEVTNFLRWDGFYAVYFKDGNKMACIHWEEVHRNVVVLGHHIRVSRDYLVDQLHIEANRVQASHAVGWLRFPDDCHTSVSGVEERNPKSLWVAFRLAALGSTECEDVAILEVHPSACKCVSNLDDAVDYILPL